MSEKCKTCANWEPRAESRGSCKVLHSLIFPGYKGELPVSTDFGCSGHTPKVEGPKIFSVDVTVVEGGGYFTYRENHRLDRHPSEIRQAAVEFLTKPRDEQAGG